MGIVSVSNRDDSEANGATVYLSYNKPVITSVNPRPFDSRGSLDEQPVQLVMYGRNFGPYINDDDDNQRSDLQI